LSWRSFPARETYKRRLKHILHQWNIECSKNDTDQILEGVRAEIPHPCGEQRNGTGKVSELTLEEIRRLDAGSWFDPKFAGEKVPTIEEVLMLVAEYQQHDVLIAVDLKAEDVEQHVVRLAKKHKVLHKLLFIGRTISETQVREKLKEVSPRAQTAVVTNNSDEFPKALAATNADWVYFRYLPPKGQVEAVRNEGKRSFIAGITVSGNVQDNWKHAVDVDIDGNLDYHK